MLDNLKLDEIVLPNETKHQIYLDAAQPTVQEVGKLNGKLVRAINAALSPLDIWIMKKEYNVAQVKYMLEQKLQNTPPEEIAPPEAYIAVPTIQALSYSMDSEQLREMYANLLAKSMNVKSKHFVHPSFPEMIKQMSPIDACILEHISTTANCGIIDLISQSHYNKEWKVFETYKILETNISGLDVAPHKIQSTSFDLLVRLGLITINSDPLADEQPYTIIERSAEYEDLIKMHSSASNLTSKKKSFNLTDMGTLFSEVCINNSVLVELA